MGHGVQNIQEIRMKLYLAGKISRKDWRTHILGERPGSIDYDVNDAFVDGIYNSKYQQEHDTFTYIGPFFISCDHGCYHKNNDNDMVFPFEDEFYPSVLSEHGAGPTGCHTQSGINDQSRHRRKLFATNCERILRSDVCLVYINENDCFGTLMEIGFMQAHGKRFYVAFGPLADHEEMWMATQKAHGIYHGSIEETWKQFNSEVLVNS
jgi:hypothetical protein